MAGITAPSSSSSSGVLAAIVSSGPVSALPPAPVSSASAVTLSASPPVLTPDVLAAAVAQAIESAMPFDEFNNLPSSSSTLGSPSGVQGCH